MSKGKSNKSTRRASKTPRPKQNTTRKTPERPVAPAKGPQSTNAKTPPRPKNPSDIADYQSVDLKSWRKAINFDKEHSDRLENLLIEANHALRSAGIQRELQKEIQEAVHAGYDTSAKPASVGDLNEAAPSPIDQSSIFVQLFDETTQLLRDPWSCEMIDDLPILCLENRTIATGFKTDGPSILQAVANALNLYEKPRLQNTTSLWTKAGNNEALHIIEDLCAKIQHFLDINELTHDAEYALRETRLKGTVLHAQSFVSLKTDEQREWDDITSRLSKRLGEQPTTPPPTSTTPNPRPENMARLAPVDVPYGQRLTLANWLHTINSERSTPFSILQAISTCNHQPLEEYLKRKGNANARGLNTPTLMKLAVEELLKEIEHISNAPIRAGSGAYELFAKGHFSLLGIDKADGKDQTVLILGHRTHNEIIVKEILRGKDAEEIIAAIKKGGKKIETLAEHIERVRELGSYVESLKEQNIVFSKEFLRKELDIKDLQRKTPEAQNMGGMGDPTQLRQ